MIGEEIVLMESQFWVEDMSSREKKFKSKQEWRLKLQILENVQAAETRDRQQENLQNLAHVIAKEIKCIVV